MSSSPVPPVRPPQEDSFTFGPWTIHTTKGIILNKEQEQRFEGELGLPHLPDMVFPSNRLRLVFTPPEQDDKAAKATRTAFEFDPISALRLVDNKKESVRVSHSQKWMEARKDSPHINNVVRPYDWTFTPEGYAGTVEPELNRVKEGEGQKEAAVSYPSVEPTPDRIDYSRLREKERILFYDEVLLYEDELDDNGCTKLSCKIRVMPSGFFFLLRFYLRVDSTLIRVRDTRIYHRAGEGHLIRERTERESTAEELKGIPASLWTDQQGIVDHLKLKSEVNEKITLWRKSSS